MYHHVTFWTRQTTVIPWCTLVLPWVHWSHAKFCGAPMVLRAWRLDDFLQAFHRTQLLLTGRNKNKYQLCWVPHGIYMYVYIYRYLCYTVNSPNISPWPHKIHRELSNLFIQFSIQSFYSCSQTCHLPLATATATCPQSCHGNLKDFSFPLFRFDFSGVGPDACLANSSMSNQCKVLGCSFPFQRYATNTCSAWISSAGFNLDRVITVILMSSLTDL